jgi:hypothetical protein
LMKELVLLAPVGWFDQCLFSMMSCGRTSVFETCQCQ